jgi:hypothetical protein
MLFDLTDPKTDIKELFKSFHEWAWIIAQKIETQRIDYKMSAIILKHIKFSNDSGYFYFKDRLVDFWFYYYADKNKCEVDFWKVDESRDLLIRAWEMAGFINLTPMLEGDWYNLPLIYP